MSELHVPLSAEDRMREFPVSERRVFFAHAGVTALPRRVAWALAEFGRRASEGQQEDETAWRRVAECRIEAAKLLNCEAEEVALIGPTALGLNLVANGLEWSPGDEVMYHPDCYPANVYPWLDLARRGVKPVALIPDQPGVIDWPLVERYLTPRTRLVALASCHFLSGYRVDVDTIGRRLQERGVLFCVDAIQTLGAAPLSMRWIDFLSADSHKWLLGPMGAGIFVVKKSRWERLRPTLLGSWNVVSPQFIAQSQIEFYPGARRYECGSLNLPGNEGMLAGLQLIGAVGVERVRRRLAELRGLMLAVLTPLGFEPYVDLEQRAAQEAWDPRGGILTLRLPGKNLERLAPHVAAGGVVVSWRHTRAGECLMRLSPHFYNGDDQVETLARVVADALRKI